MLRDMTDKQLGAYAHRIRISIDATTVSRRVQELQDGLRAVYVEDVRRAHMEALLLARMQRKLPTAFPGNSVASLLRSCAWHRLRMRQLLACRTVHPNHLSPVPFPD